MTHPTNEAAELYTAEAIDDGRGWVIPVEEGGIWYISRVAPSLLQERDRLDVDRLAEAMAVNGISDGDGLPLFDVADRIAAEYARLSNQPSTEPAQGGTE